MSPVPYEIGWSTFITCGFSSQTTETRSTWSRSCMDIGTLPTATHCSGAFTDADIRLGVEDE